MKKKMLSVLLAAAVICGMAGCSTDGSSSGSGADGSDFLVGFANNSDTYSYCAKFREYLTEETEAKGISITVTDAGGDTNVQNGQIDDFVVQNVNVISAISNDLDGSVPALESARAAGLPYVSFLTSVSGGEDYDGYIYVGSTNYDAGTQQGGYLCETFPEGAKVLYFTGAPNDQQYIDRKEGLEDALAENSAIEILDEYNVENSKDLGMSTAEDCLLSYDDIDAIVCQSDDAALGVVEALKAAGRLDEIKVLGVDGNDEALASIKAGEMAMTALQDARAQAQAGADIFEQLKNGTEPKDIEDVYIPFQKVTADNVEEYME